MAGISRLRSLLTRIFPTLEAGFDFSTKTPLALVSLFATPRELHTAGADRVEKRLTYLGHRPTLVAKVTGKAMAAAAEHSVEVAGTASISRIARAQAQKLVNLFDELREIDKEIATLFRTHQQASLLESLPGMGPGLGARFLVEINGDIGNFASAGKLAAYAGLVPVPRDSGRVSGNMRRPRRYNRQLRRVFYLAAQTSINDRSSPSRTYYERKRAANRTHTQAVLALSRRQVDVTWAVLRDGTPYRRPAESAAGTAPQRQAA